MFKKFLYNYRSWRLGRWIASGKIGRGRINPKEMRALTWNYKITSYLKELGLAFRVGRASVKAVGGAVFGQKGTITPVGRLYAKHIKANGEVVDHGLVGTKQVTTAFVVFVTDQLQTETSEFGDFRWHDSGVGTTAENVTDTDIETTDAVARQSGTQTEGASTNIYRSVGTITYGSTLAITEHGLFSQVTGGTLMDRTVFAAINVVNTDSIQFTYELTLPAGS